MRCDSGGPHPVPTAVQLQYIRSSSLPLPGARERLRVRDKGDVIEEESPLSAGSLLSPDPAKSLYS